MTSKACPVEGKQRALYWDMLRGFAVLGVLAANMPLMSRSDALDWHFAHPGHTFLDQVGFVLVRCFADTKLITIFSMLFGAGLAFMWERAQERGVPFLRTWFRRIGALAVFGVLHAALFWFGDILVHYAVMGALAVWFRKLSPKTLIIIGVVFLIFGGVFSAFGAVDGPTPEKTADQAAITQRAIEVLPSGDFLASMGFRLEMFVGVFIIFNVFFAPRTLGLFLIGMALMKSGVLLKVGEHRKLAVRAIIIGLAIGIPVQVVNLIYSMEPAPAGADGLEARMIATVSWYLMALFLSPAYMGMVALWSQTRKLMGLQRRLAAVGRMAFTNYIMHSVITSLIFNWLGFYDAWGRFAGLLLTIAIFVFQLWLSPVWLSRFRYGPLEWLWRVLTYGRKQVTAPTA